MQIFDISKYQVLLNINRTNKNMESHAQQLSTGKKIVITEGELDALSSLDRRIVDILDKYGYITKGNN